MDRLNKEAEGDDGSALTLDELFPTRGAIPEHQQIGRADVIDDLTGSFVHGGDVLMIQPRRIGKSSTIGNGALRRLQEQYGGVVAQVDLRLAGITSARPLADALVQSAIASGAGKALHEEFARRVASRTGRFLRGPRARAAGEITGDGSVLKTAQAWATLLAGEPEPGPSTLRKVLAALEDEAASGRKPVVVFIDEIQDLGDGSRWKQEGLAVQQELERAMRDPDRLVTYAFAGSEETAMEKLFAHGMPLHLEGESYKLRAIAPEAWHGSLAERFARDDRTITTENIDRILDASGGHPLRTMQVCRGALRRARRLQLVKVTAAVIDDAIAQAKDHPSWP